jgi:hypothetical protein
MKKNPAALAPKAEELNKQEPVADNPETVIAPGSTDETPGTVVDAALAPKAEELLVLGGVTVQSLSVGNNKPPVDTSLVKIKVQYPDDHKGKRHLLNGKEYEVSEATATALIKKGIAEKVV